MTGCVPRAWGALVASAVVALGLSAPRPALALTVPDCGGHVTDPSRALSDRAHRDVDQKLDKLAHDTLVDTAIWIADGTHDEVIPLGKEAFRRWGIGVQWNNGILLVIPRVGKIVVLQDDDRPLLNAEDITKVMNWDEIDRPMERRADQASEVISIVLLEKEDRHLPARRIRYVVGPLAFLLAAWLLRLREPRTGRAPA